MNEGPQRRVRGCPLGTFGDWVPVFWIFLIAMVYFRNAIRHLHSSIAQTEILPFSFILTCTFIGRKNTGKGENRDNNGKSELSLVFYLILHFSCLPVQGWMILYNCGKAHDLCVSGFSSYSLYPHPCCIQMFNSIHTALLINKQASKCKNSFWLLEFLLTAQWHRLWHLQTRSLPKVSLYWLWASNMWSRE